MFLHPATSPADQGGRETLNSAQTQGMWFNEVCFCCCLPLLLQPHTSIFFGPSTSTSSHLTLNSRQGFLLQRRCLARGAGCHTYRSLAVPCGLGQALRLPTRRSLPPSAGCDPAERSYAESLEYVALANFARTWKDAHAERGTSFANHFCTNALCCPSRVTLWTGKSPHNTNVTDVNPPHGE